MVKYDGTVRTSKEQVVQFLYGEDGFGAEFVEDLKINLMTMDNKKLESSCRFLPPNKTTTELEHMLTQSIDANSAHEIVNDPQITMKLQEEFNQLMQDRDDLRNIILKRQGNEEIHTPVNVPRIIWNAKEQFKIKPNSKTDLHPTYVFDKLGKLCSELSTIPGVTVRKDPLLL
jgi:DNA-directed RNA polymerase II subunit RPB1